LNSEFNSLKGKKLKGTKRDQILNLCQYIRSELEQTEKLSFYENMISENLSPNGKDNKMTLKMLITSSSSNINSKVDKIIDFFESVNFFCS
jgi:hypothetical protein